MTTEQRERIKAVVKPGVAVYNVPSAKALDDLVEIAGGTIAPTTNGLYNNCIKGYGFDNAGFGYDPDDNVWRQSPKSHYVAAGWIMVNYTDLPMETQTPLIIGLRAAGFPDWIDDNVEFRFGADTWKFTGIHGGFLQLLYSDGQVWRAGYATTVLNMLAHPDQIHPIPKYSAETVEDAKAAMRLGFIDVKRDPFGEIWLCIAHDDIQINGAHFPEIQPGQCVALADIVGGE